MRDITTIAYYNRNAAAFVAKTVDAAMDDALAASVIDDVPICCSCGGETVILPVECRMSAVGIDDGIQDPMFVRCCWNARVSLCSSLQFQFVVIIMVTRLILNEL